MIPITRANEPTSLVTNKATWLTELLQAITIHSQASTKEEKDTAKKDVTKKENKYRNKQIKTALTTMQYGKCAYCESNITSITYGCIEHFHPKSKFPNLCFDWDNFFLACDTCNSKAYKGTKFPSVAQGGPYINPAIEDPSLFFDFVYDPALKLASVVPQTGHTRATLMRDDFGLNRKDLQTRRSKIIRLMVIVAIQASQGDQEAIDTMQDAVQANSEYAAFARALNNKFQLHLSW